MDASCWLPMDAPDIVRSHTSLEETSFMQLKLPIPGCFEANFASGYSN